MQRVEADQRVRADLEAADEQEAALRTEDRRRTDHVRTDGDRPEGQLIPWQQVAGEAEQQRQHEQNDTNDPVELARGLIRARVEHTHHVHEGQHDHAVRHPAMHVAHQHAETHIALQRHDVRVRALHRGHVVEHQQRAGDRQAEKHEERQPAEAVRVRDLDVRAMDARRMQMQEDVRRHHQHLVAWRVRIT